MDVLTTNYDVLIPGEVLGLLALLAAALVLWRCAGRERLRLRAEVLQTSAAQFTSREDLRVRGLTLSLLAGVLLYLAFPPLDLGWLAWVALVPMILAQLTCSVELAPARATASRFRRLLARIEQASVYQALTLVVAYGLVFMHVFPSELPTGFPVPVWPFRGVFSVTLVIAASFALGTAFGVLAARLFSHVKGRRAEGVLEPLQLGQRERPGRP